MSETSKTYRHAGGTLKCLLVGLMALGVVIPALAEGTGMFGYPNLIANPDFENATIADNSNEGQWGWFKNGKVTLSGWTGYGEAGVAAVTDTAVWGPWDSGKDDYRVFIQMTDGKADDSAWIEQTITPSKSGTYIFACKYATRHQYNKGDGELGVSIVCGSTTNKYTVVFTNGDFRYRYATWYLTLEAGLSYTFRLHGVQNVADPSKDRTVVIGACSLERLPQPDRTISGEFHLKQDEDWSNATVDLAPGTAVHLDGHTLKIGKVRPNASGTSPVFTDTTANPGELRVTIPADVELANCGWSVSGGVTLVKDGAGVFEWYGGTIADTAPILITNGVFRLGTYQANLFGASGVVTVRDKGQFDINWSYADNQQSPFFGREFRVEGDGPDGSGVIVNNGVYHANHGNGYHFKKVVMTGDATFGGATRIDFRGNDVGLYGTNRTLTVKGTKVAFCEGTAAYLDCGDVVLTDGGELEPCNNGGILHVTRTCYINHGGILSSWAKKSGKTGTTQILTFPVVVGEGGGTIRRTQYWYRINAPVTVEAGSVLNCTTEGPWYGGAITNGTGATINIGGDFFAVGGIFRNDGTVVHTAGSLYFGSRDDQTHPCRVENNGTIRSTGGNFYFRSENHAHGAGAFEITGGTANIAGDLSDFTGTIRLAGGTTKPTSIGTLGGTLVLAGGAIDSSSSLASATGPVVLDLSALSAPLDFDAKGYSTLPAGKDVTVNLGDRRLVLGEQLLAWTNMPSIVFSLDATTAQYGVPLVSAADGLYFGDGSVGPVRATWTGTADNGAFADVRNWTCYDGDDNPLANTIPVPDTAITLGADVPQGGWASFPASAQTGAIDLNGHRLGITGQGSLAFSVTNSSSGTPGELRITVPKGVTFSKAAGFTIDGNLTLVKDGAGTLSWNGGTLANSVSLVVADGVFRVGIGTSGTFGTGGTITVAGTGQFDFNNKYYNNGNWHSPAKVRTFYIEGDGPDGSGALYNSTTTGAAGYQLQTVILTDDATIGGTSRLDFRGGSSGQFGLDGGGHMLTIKNTGMVAFCSGTYLRNCADIVLADGGEIQPCQGCTFQISGKIRILRGGVFANWSNKNGTQAFTTPLVVEEGGGTIKSDNYWYTLKGPITVESGCSLDFPTMAPWYNCAITNKIGATMNIYPSSGPVTPFQFVATGGIFVNAGTVNHSVGEFWLGHRDGSSNPCRVENNGTISTSGGNFRFNANSHAHGSGVFEFAGGTPKVAGDLSDFTGTIRIVGGTTTFTSAATFPGTLILRDGALASGTSLAAFTGTARIDLAGQDLPLDVDGKNWFTFAAGREVFVDVGGREFQPGDRLLSWTTQPANRVNFTLTNGQKGVLRADSSGVIYVKRQGTCIIVK